MKSLEQLNAEQEKVQKEIRQLENRRKILLGKQANEERRARTRRLIEHGAILERIFPMTVSMTGRTSKRFCCRCPDRQRSPKTKERGNCEVSNGALIHRTGAVRPAGGLASFGRDGEQSSPNPL